MNDYHALTRGAGLFDFSRRTQILLTGEDRATLLHNLCTNDIRGLQPGDGCEAFLTNVQGKILASVNVFCLESGLLLETVPDQTERLLAHLDRYIIREDVQLADLAGSRGQWLLSGAESEELLRGLSVDPPGERLAHTTARLGQADVRVARYDYCGPVSWLIGVDAGQQADVGQALVEAGAAMCTAAAALEAARIEHGTPLYGRDITDANLPQEVDRDALAISFKKGCYLGQETVARIDALGHVNRYLRGLRFAGKEVPPVDCPLLAGEKEVGRVTSAAHSPALDAPLALGYVRREHAAPGTKLSWAAGEVEVVKLPM